MIDAHPAKQFVRFDWIISGVIYIVTKNIFMTAIIIANQIQFILDMQPQSRWAQNN